MITSAYWVKIKNHDPYLVIADTLQEAVDFLVKNGYGVITNICVLDNNTRIMGQFQVIRTK